VQTARFLFVILAPLALAPLARLSAAPAPPKARSFEFTYQAVVKDIPPGARQVDVWLPLPTSDENQTVSSVRVDSPEAPVEINHEMRYGNSLLHVRLANPRAAQLPVTLRAYALRRENAGHGEQLDPAMRRRLLAPDELVPINGKIHDRAVKATRGKRTDLEKARAIYDDVTSSMKYDKSGTGWGRGDAVYACDVGRGNCTDFHSLLIGMARSVGIPGRFSIGFPLPEQRGKGEIPGYHCWAEMYVDGAWLPVDSSEASKNPAKREYFFGHHDENRIQFSTGRDLVLTPPTHSGLINFFVYPVVEVDQTAYAKVDKHFSFTDVSPAAALRDAGR